MSQEMITYSTSLPDFLKEAGGYRDEGMAVGIAPKAPKLSFTTGKQWTITDDGQTVMLQATVTDGQGRSQTIAAQNVRGVIVASSGTLTKAWYEKAYVPGTNAAPDCFSNDGKTPAPGVAKPQCANCAMCPKNAFGSHPVTGRGKACGDRKLIVVALDSMPDKLATFNVPTMSLQSLANIDGQLRSKNIPLQSVMMEFTFDPAVTYPAVKIGAVGFIGKEHFEKFRQAADSEEVRQLLREVDYDVPAETQASVVPNNVIAFGSGQSSAAQTAVEPKEPELTPKQKAAAQLKAQLAALEAEEDDDETTTTLEPQQVTQTQQQQTQTTDVLGGAQANTAGNTGNGAAAPVQRKRRTKAEMEAARLAEAAQQSGAGNALEQGVAQTLNMEPEQQTQVQQEAPAVQTTAGAPNVLDLLSKWQSK